MADPIVTNARVDFSYWNLDPYPDRTLRQNIDDMAGVVLRDIWGTLKASVETDGLSIGCIHVGSDAEETHAYFRLDEMVSQAILWVCTNYSAEHRETHIEETRENLTALRDEFFKCVQKIDAAIENPLGFTEPENTSQNDPDREERIKYLKHMCGG